MKKIEKIKSYYLPKINTFNEDYEILGWENRESHIARFESFISNIDIRKYNSFLDVGCGVGSILDYFKNMNLKISYTGVDILPEMVCKATKKHPESVFRCIDIFENNNLPNNFEIIYASGIFNINLGNNKIFLEKAINKFYQMNPHIIGFNLLHHKSPDKENRYFYFSPEETVKIIEKNGLKFKKIEIIEQYLNNDFTIICEKTN
ncbi:MAG TPA: class I SAM-dependent methyltransferase [Spirochaetota bacterium]|nr:class I SAM-dependent methyltransferase [Spirochaetota bacterium]